MVNKRGYLVIHEVVRSPERTDHGVAGGPYEAEPFSGSTKAWDAAENQLAYCHALQDAGRRGTEGRYFIAEYREVAQ